MKIKELIDGLNEGAKVLNGEKFDSRYDSTQTGLPDMHEIVHGYIDNKLKEYNLSDFLVSNLWEISILDEYTYSDMKNPYGVSINGRFDDIIKYSIERKQDNRVRFGNKGIITSVNFELNEETPLKMDDNIEDILKILSHKTLQYHIANVKYERKELEKALEENKKQLEDIERTLSNFEEKFINK